MSSITYQNVKLYQFHLKTVWWWNQCYIVVGSTPGICFYPVGQTKPRARASLCSNHPDPEVNPLIFQLNSRGMVKTQKDLKSSSFRCSNTPHKNKKSQCFTLHQVARNWSELFGFGAKIAPTMKHNTCMVRILYFLTTLDVSTMFVTGGWRHPDTTTRL